MSADSAGLTPTTANDIVHAAEQRASGQAPDGGAGSGGSVLPAPAERRQGQPSCPTCQGPLRAAGTVLHPFWECPVCGTRTVLN